MLIDARKFMFTVSLCAMLAVNPVLATDPSETSATDDTVGTGHEIYVESTLPSVEGYQTAGIAGVSYVNRMVDAAGNAAQAAEGHAAAAGAYALSAAQSADEAHEALSEKVDVAQGANNANKVMRTDSDGTVYPGYVMSGMIVNSTIYSGHITDGAIYSGHIASGAVSSGAIRSQEIYSGHIATGAIHPQHLNSINAAFPGLTGILMGYRSSGDGTDVGHFTWLDIPRADSVLQFDSGIPKIGLIESDYIATGQIKTEHLGSGAVTIDKTDGVVGMVPVGGADSTTYANFWIE